MELPRPRPRGVSPEPGREHSWLSTLIVALVLCAVSVASTLTVGAVLSARINRLEQRVQTLEALQRQP